MWALITGAAGLLGSEHARALLGVGQDVVLTDVNSKALQELEVLLRYEFPNSAVRSEFMDVTSRASVEETQNRLYLSGIEIDVLVNNASVNPQPDQLALETRFEKFSLSQWDKELSVGLTGAFICSQVFGTRMAANGRGVILNVASDLSVIAPNQALYAREGVEELEQPVKPVTYSVLKTGLIGLTRYLSTYWAQSGVRVNAISPGGVENGQDEVFVERIKELIPMRRMAYRSELRGAVKFLCSDESSYVTGQNLIVDGGRSVW